MEPNQHQLTCFEPASARFWEGVLVKDQRLDGDWGIVRGKLFDISNYIVRAELFQAMAQAKTILSARNCSKLCRPKRSKTSPTVMRLRRYEAEGGQNEQRS